MDNYRHLLRATVGADWFAGIDSGMLDVIAFGELFGLPSVRTRLTG